MADDTGTQPEGKRPRILLLYYSYSGQARKILETAGEVFAEHGCEVVEAAIEFTDPQYSEPFNRFPLRKVWPDMLSVLKAQQNGETGTIRTPDAVRDTDYDLICIGSPTWWKAPSMPIRSFLQSDEARKLLDGKPFVVFTVCRAFWQENYAEVCRLGEACGGRYTDEMHLTYPGDTVRSMLALTGFLGSGRVRERYLGLKMPPTNVQPEQLTRVRTFAAGLVGRLFGKQRVI